jgi:hypothetical protein
MDIGSFFTKVVHEYPTLLIAELLALLTLAGLAALFRRVVQPLSGRYLNSYRDRLARRLESRVESIQDTINDDGKRIIELVKHGILLTVVSLFMFGEGFIIVFIITFRRESLVDFIFSQVFMLGVLACGYLFFRELTYFSDVFDPNVAKQKYEKRLKRLRI